MATNDHELDPDVRYSAKRAVKNRDDGDGVSREVVEAVVAVSNDVSEAYVAEHVEDLKRNGEVYEVDGDLRDTDRRVSDTTPENGAEATASGLGLAALRTLLERHADENDYENGVPRDEFVAEYDAATAENLAVAIRKGVVYEADGRLHLTDGERLAEVEDYDEAREAAREQAENDGEDVALAYDEDDDGFGTAELRDGETTDESGHAARNAAMLRQAREELDREPEAPVAPGTLSTVLGVVEACAYPDSPATREQIDERAAFDDDATDAALEHLLETDEVHEVEGGYSTGDA